MQKKEGGAMSRVTLKTSLIMGILLLCAGCNSAAGAVQRMEQLDVPYTPPANGDPQMATLDVHYIPDGKPKRLMVFIHGGSWITGDKSNLKATADTLIQWFLARDYVVAVPNFRLASRPGQPQVVTYQEQATDIAYALAWLSANGSQYGVTEKAMLLLGFSSGAHLVPLIATDQSYLQSAGLGLNDIMATISLDIHMYDVPYGLQLMAGSDIAANIPLIQFLLGDTVTKQLAASPAFYAPNVAVPPALLISAEPTLPVGSHGYITYLASQRYAQLLLGLGRQAVWQHFENETHQSLVSDFGVAGDLPTAAVDQFLASLPPIGGFNPLVVDMTALPPFGTTGQFYSWDGLSTSGGVPPYTYSLASGTLPASMTLDPQTGIISGTPQTAETVFFTIQVTDANTGITTIDAQISVLSGGYVCGACHGAD